MACHNLLDTDTGTGVSGHQMPSDFQLRQSGREI